ncbi:hypothetical protein I79_009946 [Cricetulus griseus]|uniref:Uncharacterized protein n=1 Tax=Cricetulus griseus TaxID=10029 RepID=G3HH49_CRIGR|nr:hypothetical protein I79_009946 [Cricetulus griseus]
MDSCMSSRRPAGIDAMHGKRSSSCYPALWRLTSVGTGHHVPVIKGYKIRHFKIKLLQR